MQCSQIRCITAGEPGQLANCDGAGGGQERETTYYCNVIIALCRQEEPVIFRGLALTGWARYDHFAVYIIKQWSDV